MSYRAEQIDAKSFLAKHPRPVVLNFQPDTFAILQDPEDLRRWEADLKEKVGLGALQFSALSESCCESNNTNDCDTD